ncbi:MAG TPA: hypothetical protein VHX20_06220 [Terracidiphilus sp.]|jgi:hypothetical protein|nr:hypothetical protein [Terracidiphilus sp.]
MDNEQAKRLFTVLRLIQIEIEDLSAKQVAIEKVFLEDAAIRQKYESAEAEARRDPRFATSLPQDLEALRKILLGD